MHLKRVSYEFIQNNHTITHCVNLHHWQISKWAEMKTKLVQYRVLESLVRFDPWPFQCSAGSWSRISSVPQNSQLKKKDITFDSTHLNIARMIKNLSIQKINKCSRPIFCTTTLKFFKVSSSLISLSQHYSDIKFCTSVSQKINMYCSTVHSNESMLYCEFKFYYLISLRCQQTRELP